MSLIRKFFESLDDLRQMHYARYHDMPRGDSYHREVGISDMKNKEKEYTDFHRDIYAQLSSGGKNAYKDYHNADFMQAGFDYVQKSPEYREAYIQNIVSRLNSYGRSNRYKDE